MDAGEAGAIAALSALNSAALLQGPNRPAGEGGDAPKLSSELAVSNQPSMNVAETTVAETNQMNVVAANQLAAGLQQSHMYGLLLASQCAPKEMGMLKRPRPDQPPAKQGWTKKEDETILRTVREVGTKWSRIARELPGRSDDAVRNRYIRIQRKPSVSTNNPSAEATNKEGKVETVTSKRGDMWTASEDEAVLRGVNEHGLKWQVISGMLAGRSINAVRNRYLRLAPQQQQQQQQQWQLQQLQQQQQQQQLGQLQQQQFQQQLLQQQQLMGGANLTGAWVSCRSTRGCDAAGPEQRAAGRCGGRAAVLPQREPPAPERPSHVLDAPARGHGSAAPARRPAAAAAAGHRPRTATAPPQPAAHEPSPRTTCARARRPAEPRSRSPGRTRDAAARIRRPGRSRRHVALVLAARLRQARPPRRRRCRRGADRAGAFVLAAARESSPCRPCRPTARRGAADQARQTTQLPGDLAPRIDVSNLAALSAVPDAALSARFDAALSARFAAAVQQNERSSAPRAAPPRPRPLPTPPPAAARLRRLSPPRRPAAAAPPRPRPRSSPPPMSASPPPASSTPSPSRVRQPEDLAGRGS